MRWIWIFGLISAGVAITYLAFPKLNYLPEGNRNLVFGVIIPPPGINIDHVEKKWER